LRWVVVWGGGAGDQQPMPGVVVLSWKKSNKERNRRHTQHPPKTGGGSL